VAVSPSSPAAGPPDVWCLVADLLDPPEWEPEGRPELEPHQVPPAGPWDLWLLEGGRGSGKTEACARYFCKYMRTHPGARGRIIAPTFGDAVEACIEGPSGILSIDPEARWLPSAPGGAKLVWPNGSEALVFGTHSPVDVDHGRRRRTGACERRIPARPSPGRTARSTITRTSTRSGRPPGRPGTRGPGSAARN
jgi:hypothetical protein